MALAGNVRPVERARASAHPAAVIFEKVDLRHVCWIRRDSVHWREHWVEEAAAGHTLTLPCRPTGQGPEVSTAAARCALWAESGARGAAVLIMIRSVERRCASAAHTISLRRGRVIRIPVICPIWRGNNTQPVLLILCNTSLSSYERGIIIIIIINIIISWLRLLQYYCCCRYCYDYYCCCLLLLLWWWWWMLLFWLGNTPPKTFVLKQLQCNPVICWENTLRKQQWGEVRGWTTKKVFIDK